MRLFLILALITLNSCQIKSDIETDENKNNLVNEIRENVVLKLKQELNLHPFGKGSRMMYQIQMLYCAFNYYGEIEIEEARRLLMKAGKVFLNEVNKNEKVRSYLANYPFRPENIKINIFLSKSDGSELEPEKLQIVSIRDGQLVYMNYQRETNFLNIVHKETYEEAITKMDATDILHAVAS